MKSKSFLSLLREKYCLIHLEIELDFDIKFPLLRLLLFLSDLKSTSTWIKAVIRALWLSTAHSFKRFGAPFVTQLDRNSFLSKISDINSSMVEQAGLLNSWILENSIRIRKYSNKWSVDEEQMQEFSYKLYCFEY